MCAHAHAHDIHMLCDSLSEERGNLYLNTDWSSGSLVVLLVTITLLFRNLRM